jgi:hypothetical protein
VSLLRRPAPSGEPQAVGGLQGQGLGQRRARS